MRRRMVIRTVFACLLFVILMLLSTRVAYADNCGSLGDCFSTTDAAAAVTVAVAVLIAVAVLALPQLLETTTTPGSDAPEPLPQSGTPPPPPGPPGDPRMSALDVQRLHQGADRPHEYHAESERQHTYEQSTAEVKHHKHHTEGDRDDEHDTDGDGRQEQHQEQHPGGEQQRQEEAGHQVEQPTLQRPGQEPAMSGRAGASSSSEVQVPRSASEVQVPRLETEVQVVRPGPDVQTPFIPAVGPAAPAERLLGLHHVTAIASDPQRNIDFYTGLLGLRLVKATVNFDEPNTYHFYYGDALGRPGTILSFFCWPKAAVGSRGTGQVIALSFSVPAGTLGFWAQYLTRNGLSVGGPSQRFDDQVLSIFDPDGVQIDLVAHRQVEERGGWNNGRIPPECTIRGLYSVSISVATYDRTAALLNELLGFQQIGESGSRHRYQTGDGKPGALLDVISLPTVPAGTIGAGSVHHVGWRTPGDAQQLSWRYGLSNRGLNVSPVQDRLYFHSLYFYEPGGVLFDIATDAPGFTIDERPEQLGTHLVLPPWLEVQRSQLIQVLPPLRLPTSGPGR